MDSAVSLRAMPRCYTLDSSEFEAVAHNVASAVVVVSFIQAKLMMTRMRLLLEQLAPDSFFLFCLCSQEATAEATLNPSKSMQLIIM